MPKNPARLVVIGIKSFLCALCVSVAKPFRRSRLLRAGYILTLFLLAAVPVTILAQGISTLYLPIVCRNCLPPGPLLEGCPVFLPDHILNTPIDTLPVDPNSAAYIASIGASDHFHADFGSGIWPDPGGFPIGIPYNVVPGSQPKVPIDFYYPGDSDPGPYPIPANPKIEGNPAKGDRHILILDKDNCLLYEIFDAWYADGQWHGGSGAIFNLKSYALRPAGHTSADAAGLPILSGLVRYDEVAAGEIQHAIRFTVSQTRKAYIWPARHYASSLTGAQYPPMGQRFRLKSTYNITSFSPQAQVILRAMKKYGIILADNGSDWYISGVPDERWNNTVLHELDVVTGADMEAVVVSSLMIDADSGQALR